MANITSDDGSNKFEIFKINLVKIDESLIKLVYDGKSGYTELGSLLTPSPEVTDYLGMEFLNKSRTLESFIRTRVIPVCDWYRGELFDIKIVTIRPVKYGWMPSMKFLTDIEIVASGIRYVISSTYLGYDYYIWTRLNGNANDNTDKANLYLLLKYSEELKKEGQRLDHFIREHLEPVLDGYKEYKI